LLIRVWGLGWYGLVPLWYVTIPPFAGGQTGGGGPGRVSAGGRCSRVPAGRAL